MGTAFDDLVRFEWKRIFVVCNHSGDLGDVFPTQFYVKIYYSYILVGIQSG